MRLRIAGVVLSRRVYCGLAGTVVGALLLGWMTREPLDAPELVEVWRLADTSVYVCDDCGHTLLSDESSGDEAAVEMIVVDTSSGEELCRSAGLAFDAVAIPGGGLAWLAVRSDDSYSVSVWRPGQTNPVVFDEVGPLMSVEPPFDRLASWRDGSGNAVVAVQVDFDEDWETSADRRWVRLNPATGESLRSSEQPPPHADFGSSLGGAFDGNAWRHLVAFGVDSDESPTGADLYPLHSEGDLLAAGWHAEEFLFEFGRSDWLRTRQGVRVWSRTPRGLPRLVGEVRERRVFSRMSPGVGEVYIYREREPCRVAAVAARGLVLVTYASDSTVAYSVPRRR